MDPNVWDRWHGFSCAIISPPELENLCAEIMCGDEIVAWILDERDRREIRIEGRYDGEPWTFDLADFIAYARHADHCLNQHDESCRLIEVSLDLASNPITHRATDACLVCEDLDAERQASAR